MGDAEYEQKKTYILKGKINQVNVVEIRATKVLINNLFALINIKKTTCCYVANIIDCIYAFFVHLKIIIN